MPYLTYDEYKTLGFVEVDKNEFEKLIKKASAILNNVTNHFYVNNDIDNDNEWRANQFKHALASQIQYFKETGASSHYGLNKKPQSFSAGRTSVSMSSRQSATSNETPVVANEVYTYLEGTGLLYRGVQ